ncbi:hypothetical protein K7X08_030948 [Anisodus acutangulus]|uniref:Uncharacterized protein n=1 Tax=Anisodus acutangulus TaxID=402998 RepID=A0A9Q1RS43_9SOLA|nr:hypothetical protein K7X08_030948 [Anisodus acutangulus]
MKKFIGDTAPGQESFLSRLFKGTSATLEMESYNSDADNVTFNGTLNVTTNSTTANMSRDGSSTKSRDISI